MYIRYRFRAFYNSRNETIKICIVWRHQFLSRDQLYASFRRNMPRCWQLFELFRNEKARKRPSVHIDHSHFLGEDGGWRDELLSQYMESIFPSKVYIHPTILPYSGRWYGYDFRGIPIPDISHTKHTCHSDQKVGPLGLEDYRIENAQLSSSSQWDNEYTAHDGRLHGPRNWASSGVYFAQWWNVDFWRLVKVTEILTQGRSFGSQPEEWIASYYLSYSLDAVSFKNYAPYGTGEVM